MSKNLLIIFISFLGVSTFSSAQNEDPKLGTIKVRKYQEQQFYIEVESVPRYKDGSDALLDDIQGGIIYPTEALNQKISGTVMVKVIIDKFGNVINTSVHYSPDTLLNSAAMATAKGLKKFEPHVVNELVVPAQFILPVKFILPL